MRPNLAAGMVAGLAAGTIAGLAQDYPHAFPRAGATKLLENDRVIVWDAAWPSGVDQPFHRHRYDLTGVFLQWGPVRVTRLDGTSTVSDEPFEVPRVVFQAKGVTHKEDGIGPPERQAILIDLKEAAGTPPAASEAQPAFPRTGAELALDRPRVTVWDVRWPAEVDSLAPHVHPFDTLIVFLEGGTLRTRRGDGAVGDVTHGRKDVLFLPAGTTHAITVTRGTPRAAVYELKD